MLGNPLTEYWTDPFNPDTRDRCPRCNSHSGKCGAAWEAYRRVRSAAPMPLGGCSTVLPGTYQRRHVEAV